MKTLLLLLFCAPLLFAEPTEIILKELWHPIGLKIIEDGEPAGRLLRAPKHRYPSFSFFDSENTEYARSQMERHGNDHVFRIVDLNTHESQLLKLEFSYLILRGYQLLNDEITISRNILGTGHVVTAAETGEVVAEIRRSGVVSDMWVIQVSNPEFFEGRGLALRALYLICAIESDWEFIDKGGRRLPPK